MTTVVISGTTGAMEAITEGLRRQGADVLLIEDPRVLRALELLIEAASGPDGARLSRLPARVRPAKDGVGSDPSTRSGSPTALAGYEPGAHFADWRNDVLSLTSTLGSTYIGWVNNEGEPQVGVVRGSVLSPLAIPPDAGVSWANCGPGAHALAQALIADAIGTQLAIEEDFVERFVKEVIDPLPRQGFELSGDQLRIWHYRCGDG